MLILAPDGKHVIGHAGHGDIMRLLEMFSPVGGPRDDNQDIDWADDLKFFIDNDDKLLSNYIFPAVKKHEKYVDHPMAYKIYMQPVKECLKVYLNTFEIDNAKNVFTNEVLEDVAKQMASRQTKHIMDGDYKKHPGLNESSFTLQSAIQNIRAVEDSVLQVYKDLTPMAQKWLATVRRKADPEKDLDSLGQIIEPGGKMHVRDGDLKNFKFLIGSRGKRWYDNFYWNKMQSDLYTLLKTLPSNADKNDLRDFLNLNTDKDSIGRGGHLKWNTIQDNLPEVLRDIGKQIKNEDLYKFGLNWIEARDKFYDFLAVIEAEAQQDGPNLRKADSPQSNNAMLAARQRSQAEEMVNAIIKRLPANVQGDVRQAIARSDNKLQALEKEIMRRGLKVRESAMSSIKSMIKEAKKSPTSPTPRNPVARAAQSVAKGSGRHTNKKRASKMGQPKHKGQLADSLESLTDEIVQESFRSKLAGIAAAGAMGLSSMAGAADVPTDSGANKIVATINIDGETRTLDLSSKNFRDVKEASKWLEQFLDQRGIDNWTGKIERGVQGSGNYQRMRLDNISAGIR